MNNKMNNNLNILLSIRKVLNGNVDLSYYILSLVVKQKRKDDLKKSQNYWIENNFYIWLNHDLIIRNNIDIGGINKYIEYKNNLESYYKKHESILGLINYRRDRKLCDCFNEKWWKCTPKSYVFWDEIHKIIKNDMLVYDIEGYHYEDLDIDYLYDNNLLVEVNGLERIYILNDLYKKTKLHGEILFDDITCILTKDKHIKYIKYIQ